MFWAYFFKIVFTSSTHLSFLPHFCLLVNHQWQIKEVRNTSHWKVRGGGSSDVEDDCDDERNKVGGLVCQRHRQHRPQHRQAHSLILSHGATSVSGHLWEILIWGNTRDVFKSNATPCLYCYLFTLVKYVDVRHKIVEFCIVAGGLGLSDRGLRIIWQRLSLLSTSQQQHIKFNIHHDDDD